MTASEVTGAATAVPRRSYSDAPAGPRPRGREILLALAETTDVPAENFAPGVFERVCGGPDALLERNPVLVIVGISAWGQTGPRAAKPGFGTLAEAVAGFTCLNVDKPYYDQARALLA